MTMTNPEQPCIGDLMVMDSMIGIVTRVDDDGVRWFDGSSTLDFSRDVFAACARGVEARIEDGEYVAVVVGNPRGATTETTDEDDVKWRAEWEAIDDASHEAWQRARGFKIR